MDRLTSMGISNSAEEFLKSARTLRSVHHKVRFFIPTYFCICQSIELSVKGFLRGKGFTDKQLRQIGHDLVAAFQEAQANGLQELISFTDEDLAVVDLINPYYKQKDLQYSISGLKSIPEIDALIAVGERLWESTRQFCIDNRKWHQGKKSAIL